MSGFVSVPVGAPLGLAPFGRCVSCGRWAYLDENDSTCLTACEVPRVPPDAQPAHRPALACDCGAATADPVSTRRDGGPGHSDYCTVSGRL